MQYIKGGAIREVETASAIAESLCQKHLGGGQKGRGRKKDLSLETIY